MNNDVPDVSATVALDLRDVCETSNGEAEELPVQRTSDRLADGSLANTRRTHKTYDLALNRATQLADRKELQNAVLHVFQTIVVLVQNLLGVRDGVVLTRVASPRDLSHTYQRTINDRTAPWRT